MMSRDTEVKEEGHVQVQFNEEAEKRFVGSFYSRKVLQNIFEEQLENFRSRGL